MKQNKVCWKTGRILSYSRAGTSGEQTVSIDKGASSRQQAGRTWLSGVDRPRQRAGRTSWRLSVVRTAGFPHTNDIGTSNYPARVSREIIGAENASEH